MNDVYFACRDCKNYIDAGYRWPVSTLFQNRADGFPLDVHLQEVLSHTEYWSGATGHPYLAAVFPAARRFLLAHRDHDLVFGDAESFMNFDDPANLHLEWLDEASLDEPSLQTLCLEPRYFAEHPALRYSSWEQVEAYCRLHSCGWAGEIGLAAAAKRVFLRAVRDTAHNRGGD